ncbi:MAG: molybdopterin-dependent oxidoreductase [Planctomycetaceae bacterium]|nr:molybdopterin-dependent oxidoreductase [Planctomycetaceae bacterium]
MSNLLKIDGEVQHPQAISFDQLAAIDDRYQETDMTRYGMKFPSDAVKLRGILEMVGINSAAKFLNVHSSPDDFHACVPLEPIRETALLIYRLNGEPLEPKAGGPVRFFIPEHVPCKTGELDACANVKFVDWIEFLPEKVVDSRSNS